MNSREFLQLVNGSTFFEARFIDVIKVLLVMFIVTAMVWLAAYAVWLAYTVVKDKVKELKK